MESEREGTLSIRQLERLAPYGAEDVDAARGRLVGAAELHKYLGKNAEDSLRVFQLLRACETDTRGCE